MKACLLVLGIAALLSPLTSAQDQAPNELNTLLRDASYVFNRFEEVSVGVEAQIDTKYPGEIKKNSKELLSGVLGTVNMEKPALNALLGQSKVSSADLLDVYTVLASVVSELDFVSANSDRWGDQKFALDLEQLSGKALTLSTKLSMVLRSQIAAQELELASCNHKTRRAKPSHPSQ